MRTFLKYLAKSYLYTNIQSSQAIHQQIYFSIDSWLKFLTFLILFYFTSYSQYHKHLYREVVGRHEVMGFPMQNSQVALIKVVFTSTCQ